MPHRSYASTSNYRFGFNGKENDNEPKGLGNQQDYGMRIYDPRLGKFLSIDPLSEDYPFYSSYQFSSNSPILSIDVDGLEANNLVNRIENFFLGILDGFTGDQPNTPIGMSAGTTDIHAGKVTRDIPILKDNIKRLQEDPIRKVKEDVENSWSRTLETVDNLKSGDSYSWGSVLGGVVRLGLEYLALDYGIPEGPPVTSSSKVVKTKSPAGQQQKATNAETNNSNNAQIPSVKTETPSTANSKPKEAYNRQKHYGSTPTKSDRKWFKAKSDEVIDHTRSLVEHYYEGDGEGSPPGHTMTYEQRRKFAKDRSRMQKQKSTESQKQGAEKAKYSKQKKKENGLK